MISLSAMTQIKGQNNVKNNFKYRNGVRIVYFDWFCVCP